MAICSIIMILCYADSEDGPVLRKQLAEQTKHIRIFTLSNDELLEEVFTAGIVNGEEVQLICQSRSKNKEIPERLLDFSNKIQPRESSSVNKGPIVEVNIQDHFKGSPVGLFSRNIILETNSNALELMPLEFDSISQSDISKGATYLCDCTIVISYTGFDDGYSTQAPVIVVFRKQVEYNQQFVVPVISKGRNVILQPFNEYKIEVLFSERHIMYCSHRVPHTFSNDHLSFAFCKDTDNDYYSPIRKLRYRLVV